MIKFFWINLLGGVRFQTEDGLAAALTWKWSRELRLIQYMIGVDAVVEPLVWTWGMMAPDINEEYLILGLAGGFQFKRELSQVVGSAAYDLTDKLLESYREATKHGF